MTRIKPSRKHVEVVTAAGSLAADSVIVCTGEPGNLFRSLQRHVRREQAYVVLTNKVAAPVRRQLASPDLIVTEPQHPPVTIRWHDDQLVVAGGDQPRPAERGRDKVVVQRTGELMYQLLRRYPVISGLMPAYGWDVPISTTADGAMYAGPHRNYPRHLFAWATRHDPAQAFLASRIVLRHLLDESDRRDAFFAFTRG